MASKVPLSSANVPATDSVRAIQALQSDMATLGRFVNVVATSPITGVRIVVPAAGSLDVYVVSDTASAASDGSNYHLVKATRSGQSEGRTYDTRTAEVAAYKLLFLGTISVGAGDLIKVSVSVTGSPSPTLSVDNFTLLCLLTPTAAA